MCDGKFKKKGWLELNWGRLLDKQRKIWASHSWKWTGSVSQGLLMFNPKKDMKFFNFKESFSWKKMTKYFAIC